MRADATRLARRLRGPFIILGLIGYGCAPLCARREYAGCSIRRPARARRSGCPPHSRNGGQRTADCHQHGLLRSTGQRVNPDHHEPSRKKPDLPDSLFSLAALTR